MLENMQFCTGKLTDSTKKESWSNGRWDTSPTINNDFMLSFLSASACRLMKYTAFALALVGNVVTGTS